ncbi:LPXTG cell wall anchor domain-containing protein [Streptomyces sp. YIM S03343]
MKLRRAMAAAAATAAIAPLALLAAPTAFADDDQSSASPSASVSASPSDSASASTSASASQSAPAPSDSASQSAPAPSTSVSASASASTKPSDSATPTAEPSNCAVDDNMADPESQLSISVSGLPGKIVAGSGWHYFTMSAANHSDESLGTVQWLAIVDNDTLSDNEKDWLSTYAKLEYFDPQTKAWESMADEVGNGLYFGQTDLGPKETVGIKLRLDITAKAPAGNGFSMGIGGYLDQKKNCIHSAFDFYEFTVLKPGSSNNNPGEAKPGKGTKPSSGKAPQGGATQIAPTGTLASTGSSSIVPTIGFVGGVAVVLGAGVVVVARRRKAGAGTGTEA